MEFLWQQKQLMLVDQKAKFQALESGFLESKLTHSKICTAGRNISLLGSAFTRSDSIRWVQFSSVQSLSRVWLFATPWIAAARPPCPSPTPGVYSDSCPLSRWCHPAIASSVVPFSSCPQSLPASGSFPMSQLLEWGGQSTGVSASASALPMNTQDWSSLGWTGWISLQSKGLSRVFSNTTVQKHQFFSAQLSLWSNSHPYMTTGKTIALTRRTFFGKVMSLLFNMLSRLVITFLPRSKRLLISWLQSPSAVILEPKKIKSDTASTVSSWYVLAIKNCFLKLQCVFSAGECLCFHVNCLFPVKPRVTIN